MTRKPTLEEVLTLMERCHWVDAKDRNINTCTPLTELMDPTCCKAKLEALAETLGYPNTKVTASTVTKRHALMTVAAAFWAMSIWNVKLNLRAENCWLDLNYADGPRMAKLPVNCWEVEELPDVLDEEARRSAVEAYVRELFCEHITPLWTSLREASHVNVQILWENLAERVYQLYEGEYEDLSLEALVRLKTDFDYLVNGLAPETFGLDFNPLKKFDLRDENGRRVRKTCCLRYQVSRYCGNCPLRKRR